MRCTEKSNLNLFYEKAVKVLCTRITTWSDRVSIAAIFSLYSDHRKSFNMILIH